MFQIIKVPYGTNLACRTQMAIHDLQVKYASTDFRLTISKPAIQTVDKVTGDQVLAVVCATKNLGTHVAVINTHVFVCNKSRGGQYDTESVGIS